VPVRVPDETVPANPGTFVALTAKPMSMLLLGIGFVS
jgi:hypothetical protein